MSVSVYFPTALSLTIIASNVHSEHCKLPTVERGLQVPLFDDSSTKKMAVCIGRSAYVTIRTRPFYRTPQRNLGVDAPQVVIKGEIAAISTKCV